MNLGYGQTFNSDDDSIVAEHEQTLDLAAAAVHRLDNVRA